LDETARASSRSGAAL